MEIQTGDIVWAKVTGYPEWPGLIDKIKDNKAIVYFIGDPTHATFNVERLKRLKDKEPDQSNKWLVASYEAATTLPPKISISDLHILSQKIFNNYNQKPIKRPRPASPEPNVISLDERLRNLHLKLRSKLNTAPVNSLKRQKATSLTKPAGLLNSYIAYSTHPDESEEYELDDILKAFDKILSMETSSEILRDTTLMKTIKAFRDMIDDRQEDSQIKKLTRVADKIIMNWQKNKLFTDLAKRSSSFPIDNWRGINLRDEKTEEAKCEGRLNDDNTYFL